MVQKLELKLLLEPQGSTTTVITIITYPSAKVLEEKEYYKEELERLYAPNLVLGE